MFKEIIQVKSVAEIEEVLGNHTDYYYYYFNDNELESVRNKNNIKSIGARYLIKKSILDYLNLHKQFKDIEIESDERGKPNVGFTGEVEREIKEQGINNVQVSISHSRNFISTLVVFEKDV